MKHCTAHMHRIETGPVVLQSCFCLGFRVFHCCEGCGDKWASYHPCVTDMNNGRPTAKEAPESREERETEQIQGCLRERDAAFLFSLGSDGLPRRLRSYPLRTDGSLPGSVYPLFYAPLTATNLSKATTITALQRHPSSLGSLTPVNAKYGKKRVQAHSDQTYHRCE